MSVELARNLLNAQLPLLSNKLEDGIRKRSDFINWLNTKVRPPEDGPAERVWRNLEVAYTMTGTGIVDGTEDKQYRVMPNATLQKKLGGDTGRSSARIAWTYTLTNIDLGLVKDKNTALDLYKMLPKKGIMDPMRELEKWMLTGKVLGIVATADMMRQYMSLSPTMTSGMFSGLENGFLDAADPSAQTKSVLGLAKNAAYKHVNQYGVVNSAAAEYQDVLIRQHLLAGYEIGDPARAPTEFWTDRITFANYGKSRQGRIVVSTVTDDTKLGVEELPIDGVAGGKVRPTWAVNPAVDFASTPLARGWTLGLDTSTFEHLEREKISLGTWEKVPGKDMVAMEMVSWERYCLWEMAACILIAGGNRM